MKKNKRYIILLVSFAVFAAAAPIARFTRYCWNNIPAMVIPDVIISLAFSGIVTGLIGKKSTAIKIIGAIAGFLVPNVFLWGLIMPLQSVTPTKGFAAHLGFTAMFVCCAVFAGVVFFAKKNTADRKKYGIPGAVFALVFTASAVVSFMPFLQTDTEEKYDTAVEQSLFYENTFETAYPQTDIYGLVTEHFSSSLPEGKTEKKCVIIGFDGTRADVVREYEKHKKSGIKTLFDMGGHAVLSYSGGVQWPEKNIQATSTAPGWCSMMTGVWADKHGIYENYTAKSLDYPSLFLKLIEDGKAESTEFCVSWDGHFNEENCTYYPEKEYAEKNGVNAKFIDAGSDSGTYKNTVAAVNSADCPDFLFCIFEQCDHAGHQTDFGPANFGYRDAFKNDDAFAFDIIENIMNRETYAAEDWLIIITSDHGGFGSSHGGPSKQERYTFIIANTSLTAA